MRRFVGGAIGVWLGMALVAAQAPRDCARPADPPGAGAISGRMTVTRPEGLAPARRATVTLEAAALAAPKVVDSGPEGRFHFDNLRPAPI